MKMGSAISVDQSLTEKKEKQHQDVCAYAMYVYV